MGLLEKYGRKKTGEKRNRQIGAKIEPSLFDDFSAHCDNLGLSVSDGIRYLIIEELTKDKADKVQSETAITSIDNSVITNMKPDVPPVGTKGNTEVRPKVQQPQKKTSVNMTGWMINNKLPCPICERWGHRKSFRRDHATKHGYESSYDMIQSHLWKVEQMIKEKQAESEQ